MKGQDQHIKNIFSEKLGGFESPVDTGTWSSIELSISSSVGASGGAAASSVASSISLGLKIGVAVTVASAITAMVVLNLDKPTPETVESSSVESFEHAEIESSSIQEEEIKMPAIDSSSYEEIVQPVTEAEIDVEPVVFQIEDPADVYHSEEIQSYPIARGAPTVVNPTNKPTLVAEAEMSVETMPESAKPQIELSSEFTVWRDPENPMRFTFTPLMVGAEDYQWSIDDTNISSAKNLNYEFNDEGAYVVTLITSANEESSLPQEADITAYKKPEVIVPNVISPNGDGRNDALDLEFLSINVFIENIAIYDSSGSLIFKSADSSQKWDGKDQFGEACAEGSYVCIYQALGIDQKPYVGREIVRIER